MAKPRLQVDTELSAPDLRPSARPNDTYIQPSASGSQAAQLASALGQLAPRLAQLGDRMFARNTEADLRKGAEQAREKVRELDESRTSYADAVRQGLIPAHENPWQKQGYYEELGRIYAGRFQADLTSAIEQDENLRQSIEMGDFRQFTAKFEETWREENVPRALQNDAFTTGYGSRRDAILANMEAGWSAQTEERFTRRSLAMFRDESVQFIMDALDQDRSAEDIGAFLRQTWDDKHAIGWDSRLTRDALIEAVADVALAKKDATLLDDLLGAIRDGDGSSPNATLARNSTAIARIEQAKDQIFSAERREWARNDRLREEEGRRLVQEALTRFEEAEQAGTDRDAVEINDLQLLAIQSGNTDLVARLDTMRDSYRNAEYEDDNDLVAGFLQKLHRSPYALRQAELDSALRQQNLSLQTYNSLSNQLANAQEAAKRAAQAGQGQGFLEGDDDYKYADKAVRGYFTSSPDAETPVVAHTRAQAARQMADWYYRNFLAPEAPHRGTTGKAKRDLIDEMALTLSQSWRVYDPTGNVPDEGEVLKIEGKSLDWRTTPIAVPDRAALLDELQGLAIGTRSGNVSPRLVSMLNLYNVNVGNRQELADFIRTQRQFLPQR